MHWKRWAGTSAFFLSLFQARMANKLKLTSTLPLKRITRFRKQDQEAGASRSNARGVCLVSAWCPLDVSVRVMLQSHYPFGASRRVTRLWRGASHRTPRRRTRRRRGAVRREWRVRCKRHDRSPLGNTSQRGRQPPRCLNRGVVAGPRPAPVIARQLRHATLERIWRAWSWQRSPARAGDESWWYHELAIWPSSTVAGG